jgi:hypothetical protein
VLQSKAISSRRRRVFWGRGGKGLMVVSSTTQGCSTQPAYQHTPLAITAARINTHQEEMGGTGGKAVFETHHLDSPLGTAPTGVATQQERGG